MSVVRTEIAISAPIERVFDLNRSVDLHTDSTGASGERAVDGVITGLLKAGDSVTFEATHFWVRQRLTSRVSKLDRPAHFQDVLVKGAFKSFEHDHHFTEVGGQTIIKEVFNYRSPLGPLGALVNAVFLDRYMKRFLQQRLQIIKDVAESADWRKYLPAP